MRERDGLQIQLHIICTEITFGASGTARLKCQVRRAHNEKSAVSFTPTSYNRLLSCYCLILTAKIEMKLPTAGTGVHPLLLYRTVPRQRRTSRRFFLFIARNLSINNGNFFFQQTQWLLTFLVGVPVTLLNLQKNIFRSVEKFVSKLSSEHVLCCI